ncbi:MAG: hypothetical protein RL398_365 [Planctomycetota bacterium]|jgi:hypothetical protein
MKTAQRTVSILAGVCLALAACGGETKTAPLEPTKPAATTPEMGAHNHDDARELGSIKFGDADVVVALLSKIEAGGQADIDVEFPAAAKMPEVIRGWIGVESAEGSRKAKFHKEGDRGMHGHCEVPKTIPAGSKVWIEIEADGKTTTASFAY